MTTGLLLGKFMPLTKGHEYLINFARAYCDRLIVMVCSRSCEPIDGETRFRWLREAFPDVIVKHITDDTLPQNPSDMADETEFRRLWVSQATFAAEGPKVNYYFASESYGHWMAEGLGAEYVPVDPQRLAYPVSATMVREAEIYGAWDLLPAVVRKDYVKRVVVFGPESTGKTTTARYLADRLETVCVPEYGRIYTEQFGLNGRTGGWTADDFNRIQRGHRAAEKASLPNSGPIMVEDTDPLMTEVWRQMLLDVRATVSMPRDRADLYLLMDVDLPFQQDGTRYFPEQRQEFFELSLKMLRENNVQFRVISGTGIDRLTAAYTAVTDARLIP